MLFKPYLVEAILQGKKTQTRRLKKPMHSTVLDKGHIVAVYQWHRLLWRVGKTYAIQPGRGKKAVARFRLLNIRLQPLRAITYQDAKDEGLQVITYQDAKDKGLHQTNPIQAFAKLWNDIHSAPGTRWQDNLIVFALTFELVTPK